ncbi:MAG: sigma-70 family RNA polymerase sigma factor [Blastocatellia bacterium]
MITPALAHSSLSPGRTPADSVSVVLIRKIADGDEQALARLYELTKHITYRLALKMLGDQAATEETVWEVYLQIWKQATVYSEQRGTPIMWLITIARSRALDRLRREHRLRKNVEPLEIAAALPSTINSPELASLFTERRSQVRTALAQLTSAQREVLTLAFYFDMTQTEIANYLQLPLGTIKTRVRSGLLQMKRFLGNA